MPVPPGSSLPRKPTMLKVVAGTLKPEESNPNEPQAETGAPDEPDHLSELQAESWRYFVGVLGDLGVLYRADGAALEALACCHARVMQLEEALREQGRSSAEDGDSLTYTTINEKGHAMRRAKPEVQLLRDLTTQLQGWLGRFGLTPADRGRVNAAKKATSGSANPDDEFGAG